MGISQRPFLSSVHINNNGNCDLSDPSLTNSLGSQRHKKRQRLNRGHNKSRRTRNVLMKRRVRVESCRRSENEIGRKVRVLKKLIPNCEEMGVEGIFRETADYILALQMRVRVMQIMVNVLSA